MLLLLMLLLLLLILLLFLFVHLLYMTVGHMAFAYENNLSFIYNIKHNIIVLFH